MSTCPNDENSEGGLEPPAVHSSKDGVTKARFQFCAACGCADRTPRIWCSRCGAPLATDRKALQAEKAVEKVSQQALEDCAELYRAVLADQDRLLNKESVSQSQIRPIRLFYDQRLQDVIGELSSLRDHRELNKIIDQVVSVAQSGQTEQARRRLTLELRRRPENAQLKELFEEIDARYRQIQADLQAKTRAQELFTSAKAFIQQQDYEAARNVLQSARKLQPDDVAIAECFQQTEELLRQETGKRPRQEAGKRLRLELEKQPLPNEPSTPCGVVAADATAEPITASLVSLMTTFAHKSPADLSPPRHVVEATPPPSPSMKGKPDVPKPSVNESEVAEPEVAEPEVRQPAVQLRAAPSFADEEEVPNVTQRHLEALSSWTNLVKPFLMDNVGWFVGAFLVFAGFVVLIVTFWNTIEQNQILMHSLVFAALFSATGLFFAAAYFMRLKYPQLESSSDVLLVIVALLIPLVFAAAILTALIPATQTGDSLVQVGQAVKL